MATYRAIPEGYMTVGQVAEKMGTTVRTVQYYDRVGLLSPSALSDGGRRLYTDKDLLKLHQILSLKSLGFTLGDIKNRLIPLDTPEEIADILLEQAGALRKQIESLSETLKELEALRNEVLAMGQVDFKKYADIITNLQMKNDYYWLIKHFDSDTMDRIRERFDRDSGTAFINDFIKIRQEAVQLKSAGISPDSPEGISLAEKFWSMILSFTGGDMSMLPKLIEFGTESTGDSHWDESQEQANEFIGPALEAFFKSCGIDPFRGASK